MPLNIEVTEPTEHPDVTALKRKVAEAAKAHSRSNHCGEYKTWLRKLGIEEEIEKMIAVEITFTAFGVEGQKALKSFPEASLAGKSAEEQNAWVAEQIGQSVSIAGVQVAIPLEVTDLNPAPEGATVQGSNYGTTESGLVIPRGYMHAFTSNEGRVAHLHRLTTTDVQVLDATTDPGQQEQHLRRVLDQKNHERYSNKSAVCGEDNRWNAWVRTSQRSEHRVCANCTRSAERSPGPR